MQLITADPRSLKDNPDRSRQSKSSAQSDALLCASIRAIGVVQPPIVKLDPEGGNSYIIVFGHRRAAQAIDYRRSAQPEGQSRQVPPV